jgi:GNAT superfamily N-acetyltransferase
LWERIVVIRNADRDDIPRLREIRDTVRENKLGDPSSVTADDICWFIDNPGIFVWEEEGKIVGFSAADPRDGSVFALFMDQAYEGRGIAQALFDRACKVLMSAGCSRLWLTTEPGTRAERFYRKAGWRVAGVSNGNLVFEK